MAVAIIIHAFLQHGTFLIENYIVLCIHTLLTKLKFLELTYKMFLIYIPPLHTSTICFYPWENAPWSFKPSHSIVSYHIPCITYQSVRPSPILTFLHNGSIWSHLDVIPLWRRCTRIISPSNIPFIDDSDETRPPDTRTTGNLFQIDLRCCCSFFFASAYYRECGLPKLPAYLCHRAPFKYCMRPSHSVTPFRPLVILLTGSD